jgi:CTP-dependent riboflavin kinase
VCLKFIAKAIEKVRESVKYIKGSEARKIKFREFTELAKDNSSKGLWMDVTQGGTQLIKCLIEPFYTVMLLRY